MKPAERMRAMRAFQVKTMKERRVELWLPERWVAELDRLAKLRSSTRALQVRAIVVQALRASGFGTGSNLEGR